MLLAQMTAPSVKVALLRQKQGLLGLGNQKALVIYLFKFSHSSYFVWLDVYLIRCLLIFWFTFLCVCIPLSPCLINCLSIVFLSLSPLSVIYNWRKMKRTRMLMIWRVAEAGTCHLSALGPVLPHGIVGPRLHKWSNPECGPDPGMLPSQSLFIPTTVAWRYGLRWNWWKDGSIITMPLTLHCSPRRSSGFIGSI